MGKIIDYVVFSVISSILILFFYSPTELCATFKCIISAGVKFYFLLTVIMLQLYFLLIFIEWIGFKILDRLINDR